MLKILLKLWPALTPIVIYFLWNLLEKFLRRKSKSSEEKIVGESSTEVKEAKKFSLQNRNFVLVLYLSLIVAIVMLIRLGL